MAGLMTMDCHCHVSDCYALDIESVSWAVRLWKGLNIMIVVEAELLH